MPPKPNYKFEKRKRDLAKKAKQEEKRAKKLVKKDADGNEIPAEGQPGEAPEGSADGDTDPDAEPSDEPARESLH
jgi:hypothetical protein